MMKHYVSEREEEHRQASNRMYHRILASLQPEVARRYGHIPQNGQGDLKSQLEKAIAGGDWARAAQLAGKLARQDC
jgi:hypothetical protein